MMSVDARGFKSVVQGEARTFLRPEQLLLNATVMRVRYFDGGVEVELRDGSVLRADYAICTFRCVERGQMTNRFSDQIMTAWAFSSTVTSSLSHLCLHGSAKRSTV